MKTCIKCGSHAFNLYAEGIDQGDLCDVHYWQDRAQRAEAQPVQEPVAYFNWLPEGATHLGQLTVNVKSGGALKMRTYAFKYEDGVLMVYQTDNDNEYPGWREAKQCFYHLNFPVFPIPTAPPQRPWVELTEQDMPGGEDPMFDHEYFIAGMVYASTFLKKKNT